MIHNLELAFGFGLVTASILALGGMAITLQFGVTNYINFACGAYMTLAAYLTWELNTALGLNFWLALVLGAICLGGFAVLANAIVLQPFSRRRPPPIVLLMVTLGLWLIVSNLIVVIWGTGARQYDVGGVSPLHLGPLLLTPSQLLILVAAVLILAMVQILLTRTKMGKAMRAMSDDPALAEASGINTEMMVHLTWLIAGILMGVAGAVLALNVVDFGPGTGDSLLFVIFAAVILGGIGQPYGAMLGALLIGLTTEMSAVILPSSLKEDVAFVVLIITLLIRPQGIVAARGRH